MNPKKNPSRGVGAEGEGIYFFTQAGLVSFSFLEQSTFLSSILPPPWAPAKAGMDTNMKAETKAVITNFIKIPSSKENGKKARIAHQGKPTHTNIVAIIKGTR